MNIEKFSTKDGQEGVNVKFTFTSQSNKNGVNFNPLSVFTKDAVSSALTDLDHDFNYERFSSDITKWDLLENRINGHFVEHDVEMETTDKSLVEVVTSETFQGFSANITPLGKPVPSRTANPRFYGDGDLKLEAFTALQTQSPAFIGADKVKVETFSVSDNVLIMETFSTEEDKDDQEANPEANPEVNQDKVEDKPKANPEVFSFWGSVGSYAKTQEGQIGKVTKITRLENNISNYTLKLLDGSTLLVVSTENNERAGGLLNDININDVMDYFLTKSSESSSQKNEDPENKGDQENGQGQTPTPEETKEAEKFAQIKTETERFNSVTNAKGKVNTIKQVQHGAGLSGNGQNKPGDGYKTQSIINKIV